MTEDLIDFAKLIDGALRGVLRRALECATDSGLPGLHKFYITFETKKPGVSISSALAAQYPEEMTIVLEHQFWDLDITEDAFSVISASVENVSNYLYLSMLYQLSLTRR